MDDKRLRTEKPEVKAVSVDPQAMTWDSPIKDLFLSSYSFSPDLVDAAKAPRLIRMYEDRWSIRWDQSDIGVPQDQSCLDIFISVRPVSPSTIVIKV